MASQYQTTVYVASSWCNNNQGVSPSAVTVWLGYQGGSATPFVADASDQVGWGNLAETTVAGYSTNKGSAGGGSCGTIYGFALGSTNP
jgi:hypothetical protein